MASLPVTIFKFAMSPYENWQKLAWAGVFLITLAVLVLNILARVLTRSQDAKHRLTDITEAMPHDRTYRQQRSKIAVKDLNFYYGKFHALEGHQPGDSENKVTAFIGPSGCGKSTLLRVFNRMFELYPEQRAEGEILLDGENMLDQQGGRGAAARQGRHGVPEADAVSRCRSTTTSPSA